MCDAEVVAAADRLGAAMVFTGVRHFRHKTGDRRNVFRFLLGKPENVPSVPGFCPRFYPRFYPGFHIKNPVMAIPTPATPAMTPSTGNMPLRAMKYSELSTSPISSNPSPTS